MSAPSKNNPKRLRVSSSSDNSLEDATGDCRDQVLLGMLIMLMDKVERQERDIQKLKEGPPVSKSPIRKPPSPPRPVALPPKLRGKRMLM